MKFAIAAGILTQVLPAISEKYPSKPLAHDVSSQLHDLSLALQSTLNLNGGYARGGETNEDQRRQVLDGQLKNVPFAQNMKACDPSSNDPDVGILSCDTGYECVFDQDSTLGGLCTSISRDLQEPEMCYLCGDGSVMGTEKLGIAVEVPDYQGLNCGIFAYIAYIALTFNATSCAGSGFFVQAAGCCVPSYDCNICGDGELLADVIFQDNNITAKCGWVAQTLNETTCTLYSPYIAPTCCDSSTTAASGVPTPAPVAIPFAPAPDAPAPTTPSGAEGRWSTHALVSMMSLTVVTAGSLLLH